VRCLRPGRPPDASQPGDTQEAGTVGTKVSDYLHITRTGYQLRSLQIPSLYPEYFIRDVTPGCLPGMIPFGSFFIYFIVLLAVGLRPAASKWVCVS
jgi:hypothetical protein